jgi:hypothetical protein
MPARITSAGNRIVATPYARRLARNTGLDLATVVASNGRRIRALDIEAALAERDETRSNKPTEVPHAQQGVPVSAAAFAFYGAEVCFDRLQRLLGEIESSMPDLRPLPVHFVALAAARVLGPDDRIGLQHGDAPPRALPAEATRRLSAIVAADRGETAMAEGPVALIVSDAEGATRIGRAPAGCAAALGVGAQTQVFRPDAEGKPVLRSEISLVLTVGDAGALPGAAHLLARICAFLEHPLGLLAS